MSKISGAFSIEEKQFCSEQEGMKKKDERAFSVLVSRLHISKHPFLLWEKGIMERTMKVCITLNNMIVEACRDGYFSELFDYA